jgi:hypothetical protein
VRESESDGLGVHAWFGCLPGTATAQSGEPCVYMYMGTSMQIAARTGAHRLDSDYVDEDTL